MSISFSVQRETLVMVDGKMVIRVMSCPDAPEVNFSSENAIDVLKSVLCFVGNEECGTIIDVQGFKERCDGVLDVLRAVPDLDSMKNGYVERGEGRATMIHCSQRAGAFTRRIELLRALAIVAIAYDATIVYY